MLLLIFLGVLVFYTTLVIISYLPSYGFGIKWPGQAKYARDAGQDFNFRPGKFSELCEFMTIDEGYRPKYVHGAHATLEPGDIIYIKDVSQTDTRINRRVMLVLFHNHPFSYTCLSFCYHPEIRGTTLEKSHALVYTGQNQQPALQPDQAPQENTSLLRLEINLRYNNNPFSLQSDIYLDMQEHWNIEKDVQLVTLGRVERASYKRLIPEITRLFCQSLGDKDVVMDSGSPSASNSQKPAGLEKKKKVLVYGNTGKARK